MKQYKNKYDRNNKKRINYLLLLINLCLKESRTNLHCEYDEKFEKRIWV